MASSSTDEINQNGHQQDKDKTKNRPNGSTRVLRSDSERKSEECSTKNDNYSATDDQGGCQK
jgi:hypothetical protein